MEGSMKQLTFVTKGEVRLDEVPIPEVPDNGVLIKIAYCGICGSDIHAYTKGGLCGGIADGSKFGHEFSGIIVEVGKDIKDYKVGDRVWADPNACVVDPRFVCMGGGFSEYAVWRDDVPGANLYILPDDVSLRAASLIEPFGVGVHTKNRAEVKPGDKVIMFGAGPIGLMGWAAMKHQGVDDVIVAERMPSRLEFAKKLGVHVFDNTETDVFDYAAEQFGVANIYTYERTDADVVLDYVGAGFMINEYLEKGRCNSRFCTLGLDKTPLTIDPGEFMSKQLQVRGSRSYTADDIVEVIEVLQDKNIDIASIITGEFPLEEATQAFESACDRENGLKTIIRIDGSLE